MKACIASCMDVRSCCNAVSLMRRDHSASLQAGTVDVGNAGEDVGRAVDWSYPNSLFVWYCIVLLQSSSSRVCHSLPIPSKTVRSGNHCQITTVVKSCSSPSNASRPASSHGHRLARDLAQQQMVGSNCGIIRYAGQSPDLWGIDGAQVKLRGGACNGTFFDADRVLGVCRHCHASVSMAHFLIRMLFAQLPLCIDILRRSAKWYFGTCCACVWWCYAGSEFQCSRTF